MWVPNGETWLLAAIIVTAVLSVVGFVVLIRQARRECGAR